MSKPQFSIFSMNVSGLNIPFKRHALFRDLHKHKPAIVCVQEMHFGALRTPYLRSAMYPVSFHSTAQTKSRGISVLFHKDWVFKCSNQYTDPLGRLLILVGTMNELPITVANLYLPNVNPVCFLKKAYSKIKTMMEGSLFMCGDFNCVPDTALDTRPGQNRAQPRKQPPSSRQLNDFFYDPLTCMTHGELSTPRPGTSLFLSPVHSSYSRIDLCLIHGSTVLRLLPACISSITWSDHAPITLDFEADYPARGMGNWRLNDSLLVSGADVSDTSAVVREYFALNVTEEVTISSAWLAHKAVVRGHLIQRGATRKKAFNAQMTSVQRQISDLESQHKINPTPDLLSRLGLYLIQLTLQSSERAIRRLNLTQYTQGNKAGRLLASKLKSKRLQTKISYLLDNGGDRIYNPLKISEEFADFYASLYKLKSDPTTHDPDPDEITRFLQDAELPSLSRSQAAELLVPFTEEEVRKAVKALPKNKAPGPDGFSNLYYQTFADILIPTLTRLFNHIKTTGVIPPEMLQATIVTLPKPGKPPTSCANVRPISLLNVDAKLYAKLLVSRMAPLLPLLISAEQTGFVPGRQTCDNTRRFYNIIDIAYRTNTTGLLLALDAEKAFDRLHWGYMRKALEFFGFPALFINSIMNLYSLPTAKVLASGFLSSSFSITNGTRQGCPLSPLIFVLAWEPLASRIRRDSSVSGISTPDGVHKLAMFADDILIFLTSSETSLPSLMRQLTSYGLVSYYINNVSKTQALPLHVDDFSLSTLRALYPFDWRTTSLKYLGISLTKSRGSILKLNYNPLMTSISSQLNSWLDLEVSWMGRMAALKMCILPQILYFFSGTSQFLSRHICCYACKKCCRHTYGKEGLHAFQLPQLYLMRIRHKYCRSWT
uniref:Reverse transcriptase domain-containing protein n=1 Tax=Leptobrachium leishanense TaxID=445787 RepID=A0A8C5P7R3_9ANUR